MIVRDRYCGHVQIADRGSCTAQMTGGTVVIHAYRLGCVFTGLLGVSSRMVVAVMTLVLSCNSGFVLAIACHGCPAELQGQQHQQENRQIPFHGYKL